MMAVMMMMINLLKYSDGDYYDGDDGDEST